VVNTPRERAALYFRSHPTRVLLLADPDARTHRLFGLPSVVPDEAFAAVRSNPTGELPGPLHPMEANAVLNAQDGFALTAPDCGGRGGVRGPRDPAGRPHRRDVPEPGRDPRRRPRPSGLTPTRLAVG
jgi:hypothetical protein